jgi:ribosomal protein S9
MRWNFSEHLIRALAATALATGICVPLVRAQAVSEYTLGVSKSAAGAAGFGDTLSRAISKATNQLSDKLQTQTHESPAQVTKENRAASKKAGEAGGRQRLASDPAPSEIKLPQGKLLIEIARPDRAQWSEQATVAKGKNVDIGAKPANPYPSVVTLTFKEPKKER